MFSQSLLPRFKRFAPEKCRRKRAMAGNLCIPRTASRSCSRQKRREYTEILRKMRMGRFLQIAVSAVLFALLMLVPAATANQEWQKPRKKEKSIRKDVLNFDGGIFFETDGSLSEITCFRVSGRAGAPHFFENFKRIDDEHGTQYRRGQEVVKEFPEELHVPLVIFDFPCASQLEHLGPRRYLTQDMMRTLRFSFYWKRGLELRRIENFRQEAATAEPV